MRVAYIQGESVTLRQLPKDWKNILNFHKKSEKEWNAEGFYKVVEPTIDPATQKKGAGYLDGNVYTYAVEPKTQEEQDAYNEAQLNSDVSQQAIDQRRADGQLGYDRIMAIIERKYRTGEITANQAKNALDYFDPLVEALNRGQWILVQIKLNDQNLVVSSGYRSLYDTVKAKVDTYIQNNY
jgi:hypothetical protein